MPSWGEHCKKRAKAVSSVLYDFKTTGYGVSSARVGKCGPPGCGTRTCDCERLTMVPRYRSRGCCDPSEGLRMRSSSSVVRIHGNRDARPRSAAVSPILQRQGAAMALGDLP